MGTQPSVSQQLAIQDSLAIVTSTAAADFYSDSQKAWYLLSLLLSIGRPAPLLELSSRCAHFQATPDLVRRLCSLPNSPIVLTYRDGEDVSSGCYLTVSALGILAVRRLVPHFGLSLRFPSSICSRLRVRSAGDSLPDVLKMYFRKRKRIGFVPQAVDKEDEDPENCRPFKRYYAACLEAPFSTVESVFLDARSMSKFKDIILPNRAVVPECFSNDVVSRLEYSLNAIEHIEDERTSTAIVESEEQKLVTLPEATEVCCLKTVKLHNQRTNSNAETCDLEVHGSAIIPMEFQSVNDLFYTTNQLDGEHIIDKEEIGFGEIPTVVGGNNATVKTGLPSLLNESEYEKNKVWAASNIERVPTDVNSQNEFRIQDFSTAERRLQTSSPKSRIANGLGMSSRHQALHGIRYDSPVKGNKKQGNDHKRTSIPLSLKQTQDDAETREGRNDVANVCSNNEVERKDLPSFESYTVEEEEGSGGYGIVYRATKKHDGTTVAIKCPHAKVQKHHVSTEQRMLERFGGRDFIIRYEGCFKSEHSKCFVLEYVEHDRPEVLKKEIDLEQLRWYGFCLFSALSTLHKQGIVHRDVKPGNFLFSRKANKGYLIDFNLALDLQQTYGTTKKIKASNDNNFNDTMLQKARTVPPANAGKTQNAKSLAVFSREGSKSSKKILEPKNSRKKTDNSFKTQNDIRRWNVTQSQDAEGSGITSVKDATSTRTPPAVRVRQPLPSHGRKELLTFAQDAICSRNHEASSAPASLRKRIAAPPSKVDGRLIYVTPMPLRPSSMTITVGGLTNRKDGKLKNEGPCVGTKGFRAPEVLLRSTYQGHKVDSWSSGVTLLYLMIGRTPFYGEPEQNINEIAKLRGSEDLWEVAKLHDRESSFPPDLYNTQSLPSLSLREWCRINTKRRGFLDQMPASLIDLVDKCLTVNPRSRISAEDALKHEFFAPMHELKKQKLVRKGLHKDSGTKLALHGQSSSKSLAVPEQQAAQL